MCEYDYGQDPAPDAAEQPDAGCKGFVCPPPPPTGGADSWVLSQEGVRTTPPQLQAAGPDRGPHILASSFVW